MCISCATSGQASSWGMFGHDLPPVGFPGSGDEREAPRTFRGQASTFATGSDLSTQSGTGMANWVGLLIGMNSGLGSPPTDYGPQPTSSGPGDANMLSLLSGLKWNDSTVTYAFPDSLWDYPGWLAYPDSWGFQQLNNTQRQAARYVLEGQSPDWGPHRMSLSSVETVTDLSLEYAGQNSGHIQISTSNASASRSYFPEVTAVGGDVWIKKANIAAAPQLGTYAYHTMMHELGHALGLKHAHEGRTSGYGVVGAPMNADRDSLEFTAMTYRSHVGAPTDGYTYESYGAPQTFMMYDIAALQHLYGADFTTNNGNTVYSWSPTTGEAFVDGEGQGAPGSGRGEASNRIFLTIWDGGGTDTYDFSNYETYLDVNLAPGGWSRISSEQTAALGSRTYARGNVFNALQYRGDPRSLIENAYGGTMADTIVGNVANNTIRGNGGDDVIKGMAGNDILHGGDGEDRLFGGDGNDNLTGDAGSDTLDGGESADLLRGGTGDDIYDVTAYDAVYENAGAGTDTVRAHVNISYLYANVENLVLLDTARTGTGNSMANAITGNALNNTLNGAAGNDVIRGQAGDDVILGGDGDDQLIGGDGNDNLTGGAGNDNLDGGESADILRGGAGNDAYTVTAYDAVYEDAGAGTDTVYALVNISYLYANVENLVLHDTAQSGTGNALANSITGNALDNILDGRAGNDILAGHAGDDQLFGDDGNDELYGGVGDDRLFGGNGDDRLFGNEGNDQLSGGNGSDTLDGAYGSSDADHLIGGAATTSTSSITRGIGWTSPAAESIP